MLAVRRRAFLLACFSRQTGMKYRCIDFRHREPLVKSLDFIAIFHPPLPLPLQYSILCRCREIHIETRVDLMQLRAHFRVRNRERRRAKFASQEAFEKRRTEQWRPTIYTQARFANQPWLTIWRLSENDGKSFDVVHRSSMFPSSRVYPHATLLYKNMICVMLISVDL